MTTATTTTTTSSTIQDNDESIQPQSCSAGEVASEAVVPASSAEVAHANDDDDDGEIYKEKYRRWVLYGLTFVLVSVSAGTVYGWPALRRHLIENDGSTLTEKQLGVVFTVGSWATQGGRFFVGLARDRFGTRNVLCSCLICAALGNIGVAFSDPDNVAALSVSLCAMGIGSGVQLTTQPVASLFPQYVGVVTASLSGAFQISGLIFLALTSGSADRQTSFLMMSGTLCVLTVVSAFLYPVGGSFLLDDNNNEKEEEEQEEEEEDANRLEKTSYTSMEPSVQQHQPESNSKATDDSSHQNTVSDTEQMTALKQMKTKEYILLLLWFTVALIPMQYYVGIIGYSLEQKGDDDGFYSTLFAWVYAGATIVSPFAGFLSDKCGLGIAQGTATALVAFSLFILASNVRLEIQSVGMVAYGIGRLAIFGYYFGNIAARFGYLNFGTLAGIGLLVSAIASLVQIVFIDLASSGYDVAVNIAFGIVLLALFPYFIWLHRRQKLFKQGTDF
eukprot:CAMPEP_0113503782 /NCGR_PEP_ID=MMETSP0014_2-20120614/34355_1 /TAXON_ID=2857 /ORGANISM="Nitzschia sp." /LENGTH=502 /DNA_ID=CAMNT_0000398827 /DNA_START=147 /DNA_END=1655 /DNA_ORIENTATION=+ /assembly_acc=CAM_ASM_000159